MDQALLNEAIKNMQNKKINREYSITTITLLTGARVTTKEDAPSKRTIKEWQS